jgi:hypothetical protein
MRENKSSINREVYKSTLFYRPVSNFEQSFGAGTTARGAVSGGANSSGFRCQLRSREKMFPGLYVI